MTIAIAQKIQKPFPNVKTAVDCITVGLGVVLTIVFLHKTPFVDAGVRIREGTILAAIITGKLIAFIRKPLSPIVRKMCFTSDHHNF